MYLTARRERLEKGPIKAGMRKSGGARRLAAANFQTGPVPRACERAVNKEDSTRRRE